MSYNFYIDGVLLPIAPSKVQTKISNKNKTITLIDEGEINLLKKAGLTDIEFDAIFPQTTYPFATYVNGFRPASFFLEKLEQLKLAEKPFQFIVSRVSPARKLLFDTNMKVSLEDYIIIEDAKDGFDVVVSIKLRQYRDYGTKTVLVKAAPVTQVASATNAVSTVSATKPREVSKPTPRNHTVVKGDTLWAICKKHLGDGSKYPEIAKLNGIKNPNLIRVGQVIKLE